MAKYNLTNKAVDDLSNIWEYSYETWSENQADKYYEELIYFCRKIAEKPNIGKHYVEINDGILGFYANSHIIFYRIINHNEIEILRILHGSMGLKNRMKE